MTERIYYTNSFLTDFDAVVTDIQELSRASGQSLWRVALDRSAFYPTSGGQPNDTGSLIAIARSGAELTADVVNVEEDEHDEVWHYTAKPLTAGTRCMALSTRLGASITCSNTPANTCYPLPSSRSAARQPSPFISATSPPPSIWTLTACRSRRSTRWNSWPTRSSRKTAP